MNKEEMLTKKDWLAIHKLEDEIALSRYDIEFHKLPDKEQGKISELAEKTYFKRRNDKMKLEKGKRKPSAFNRCVGNTLLDATYKNKKQWQGVFKKAVKKCRSNPAPVSNLIKGDDLYGFQVQGTIRAKNKDKAEAMLHDTLAMHKNIEGLSQIIIR